MKEILIIDAHSTVGKSEYYRMLMQKHNLDLIQTIEMNTIEINGIKYQQNEPEKRSRAGSRMLALSSMMLAMSGVGMPSFSERKRPSVDIVKEYGLIQLKQSNLSRNDRDWVVYQFERHYTKL